MKLPFLHKAASNAAAFKCPECKAALDVAAVRANLSVCTECGYHFLLSCRDRVDSLVDEGTFEPLSGSPVEADPLGFADEEPYANRLAAEREATGQDGMALAGAGRLMGHEIVLVAMDVTFLRGSMGVAAGELVAAAAEHALDHERPLVIVANSAGGARIHEGVFALMQMAKTAAAVARLDRAGGLFISVIANPTMGGVMASFASLGDVTLAEPGAVAGYTSAQIIEQTVKKDLPDGFQTAEYLMERGFVDAVVPRPKLRGEIARIIALCRG